jgi:hypothetical protein
MNQQRAQASQAPTLASAPAKAPVTRGVSRWAVGAAGRGPGKLY